MTKTVLITGASSGIGKATAIYFASRGWQVAATMRSPQLEHDLNKIAGITLYQLDVTDEQAIHRTITKAITDFGHIDALVNNAGYGTIGAFEASTAAEVQQQFDVNDFGLMNVTRALLPHLRANGRGHIINVGSMGGRLTFPLYSVYHATKWAVDGFSESLMYELSPLGLRVKLIEPGLIKTEFQGRSEFQFKAKDLPAYDTYTASLLQQYHKASQSAPGPEIVAKAIFQAATDSSSRLRYVAGNQARLLLTLKRLLPERWYFAATRRKLRQP
ncbi:MAG TPA: SDR family oxidoreductase [Hymenobacter sp.]